MKAKEYAAVLVAAASNEIYEDKLFGFLEEFVKSTVAAMKQRHNVNSQMACVRETFTKWKSIVAQVKSARPDLTIDDALFVKYFSYASPPLFAVALEQKVFLGYTPDAQDLSTVASGREQLENMMLKDRLAELQREAKKLGIRM